MRTHLITLIFAVLILDGCGACGEDKLSEATSPSNKYVATVFRRGCGATTGFLYHVNLKLYQDSFSPDLKGAIESGQVFLTREGKITLSWKDDKTLQVKCDGCPKDRKAAMESSWKDVSISFDLH
jgi:hypothetical protein